MATIKEVIRDISIMIKLAPESEMTDFSLRGDVETWKRIRDALQAWEAMPPVMTLHSDADAKAPLVERLEALLVPRPSHTVHTIFNSGVTAAIMEASK